MNKEELMNECKKYNGEKLRGIYIIQERKLHDSGYRLMNVIGHSEYDEKIKDYHYYLLSECSDVVDFNTYWSKIKINNLNIDINKNGIIHIWSNSRNDEFVCICTNVSTCELSTGETIWT